MASNAWAMIASSIPSRHSDSVWQGRVAKASLQERLRSKIARSSTTDARTEGMKLALLFMFATTTVTVASANARPLPSGAVVVRAPGSSCAKTADCGSPGLFCEYTTSGCRGTTGTCRSASCRNDPMNVTYCGCDGKTSGTASGCMPDRPFAALGPCP